MEARDKVAVAAVKAAGLAEARGDTAFAQSAVNVYGTSEGLPALSNNAPSVAPL